MVERAGNFFIKLRSIPDVKWSGFTSAEHKIALSVLGTDYNNWVVAYGMLGSKGKYNSYLILL